MKNTSSPTTQLNPQKPLINPGQTPIFLTTSIQYRLKSANLLLKTPGFPTLSYLSGNSVHINVTYQPSNIRRLSNEY